MCQIDPIVTPDYYFEERGMKHFNGGWWEPTLILGHMNERNMGNYLMEARPVHSLAPIMEEQNLRSTKYGGLADVNEGNRRVKVD